MKKAALAILFCAAAFGQSADVPTINSARCGDLPCQWILFPSKQAGLAPYDQIHIYAQSFDERVKAFEIRVRYTWQGQAATSEHVTLRRENGVGMLTMYFNDIREVEIKAIRIKTLIRQN